MESESDFNNLNNKENNIDFNLMNKRKDISNEKLSDKDFSNMDENEINEINKKLKITKQEQKKEIESLEKELNDLKKENSSLNSSEDKNIILNEELLNQIKSIIIKEIKNEFEMYKTTLDQNLNNFINDNQKKYNDKCKTIKNKDIVPEINKIKKETFKKYGINQNKTQYQNQNQNNNDEKKSTQNKLVKREKNQKKGNDSQVNNFNRNINNEDNSFNSIKDIKKSPNKNIKNENQQNIYIIKNEENIPYDDDNNNIGQIPKFKITNNSKTSYFPKDINNKQGLSNWNKKNQKAIILKLDNLNMEQQKNLYQKKKSNEDLFSAFNNIFFENKEQTRINLKKDG